MNNIDYKAVVKILENFLKKEKTEILGISVGEEHQLRQAIENLIQKNKELKEKYLLLNQINDIEKSQHRKSMKELLKDINNNYIPKSKVKEKIKEYNIPIFDVLDKLPIPRTIERGCGAKDGIIYVLQELLEEGE